MRKLLSIPLKKEHKKLLDLIAQYLNDHPEIRFGQALFNLDINQFKKKDSLGIKQPELRDIYNDLDQEILMRLELRLNKFGNEE